MNKKIYQILKKAFLKESQKNKIERELFRNWSEEDLLKYNVVLNSENGKIMSETECKYLLLTSNKTIFNETEYSYYNNILSLEKILKKRVRK